MCRIYEEMKPAYSIRYGKGSPVICRGKLFPVRLSLVQKMGNKKVTLVDNLECYGIPASDLAQSLQKLAAASTTCKGNLSILFSLSLSQEVGNRMTEQNLGVILGPNILHRDVKVSQAGRPGGGGRQAEW